MIAPHRPLTTPYGTDTFAAHLAAREAALGLAGIAQTTQGVHKPIPQPGSASGSATDPDASPPMGDMGQTETALSPAEDARRRWGIVATSAPRLDGAYTFTSRTWEPGGRVVYVCGSPAAHVAAGHWTLDGRMSAGQGYVCALCHPQMARQWGIGREWRR